MAAFHSCLEILCRPESPEVIRAVRKVTVPTEGFLAHRLLHAPEFVLVEAKTTDTLEGFVGPYFPGINNRDKPGRAAGPSPEVMFATHFPAHLDCLLRQIRIGKQRDLMCRRASARRPGVSTFSTSFVLIPWN